MFFLALMFVLVLYVVFALTLIVTIRRSCTTWRGKNISTLLLLLAAVLVPTGDHIVGHWVFKQECSAIGEGIQIAETVDGVEGFLDASGRWFGDARPYGYRFVEVAESDNSVARWQELVDGQWGRVAASNAMSLFEIRRRSETLRLWDVVRSDLFIVRRAGGARLAQLTSVSYGGGWVANAIGGGLYGHCGGSVHSEIQFIRSVLRPATQATAPIKQ